MQQHHVFLRERCRRARPSAGGRRCCRPAPATARRRRRPARSALSRLRNSFRFCIVPPTAPIEHMLPTRSSGNVQSVQMRGREPPEPSEAAPAGAWPAIGRGAPAGGVGAPRARPARAGSAAARSRSSARRAAAAPSASRSAAVSAWAMQRHERAADADAEVGEAHRLAAAGVEPAREQHLVRQRAAADVAERVEQVERCRRSPATSPCAEPDRREAGEQDADDHQPARAEAVDEPAGEEPEERADDQLASRRCPR